MVWRTNRKTERVFHNPSGQNQPALVDLGDTVFDSSSGKYGTVIAKQWLFGWQYLVEYSDGSKAWRKNTNVVFVD